MKKIMMDQFEVYTRVYSQWMMVKRLHIDIGEYLRSVGVSRPAIYGLGTLGFTLYYELLDAGIEPVFAVDREAGSTFPGFAVLRPDEAKARAGDADAVIVTPLTYYREIARDLKDIGFVNIMGLDDVLCGMMIYEQGMRR